MCFYVRWFKRLLLRSRLRRRLKAAGSLFLMRRDRLSEEERNRVSTELGALDREIRSIQNTTDTTRIELLFVALEQRLARPKSMGQVGMIVEFFFVILVLVFGVRTFFFHPMSIPTGSMEPTFMGDRTRFLSDSEIASPPGVFRSHFSRLVLGEQSIHLRATKGGVFQIQDPLPRSVLWILKQQRFSIDGAVHKIWFPPKNLWARAGLESGMIFSEGDDVIRLKVESGDHLLVNRWVYHFRRPRRGEAVVLTTEPVELNPMSQFYLKRLVGFGRETVRIADDRMVRIDEKMIDSSMPGFEKVAQFTGSPTEGTYSGYLNGTLARQYRLVDSAPLFPTELDSITIRAGHVFVLGDNSVNSLDSRTWGDFPQEAIIGRPSFVFWPLSKRFGFAEH